jgi:hypothetical protein
LGHATKRKTKFESGVKHELEMKSGRGLLAQFEDNTPVLLQTQNLSKKKELCTRFGRHAKPSLLEKKNSISLR